jgi:1,4-dihydroxy-2-naphthoate octaprenyltransferase
VLFYTWPLKYIGLGEIAVIIVWGPLMIGGGYYVITGAWDWNIVWAGLPYALGATTVIFGKHIDKMDKDAAKNIRTLPVLLGERNARYTVLAMMVAQYLIIGYLVVTGFFSPVLLIVALAFNFLKNAYGAYKFPKPKEAPANLPPGVWPLFFVGYSFVHSRRFGLLFLLGLIGDLVVRAVIR